MTKEYRYYTYKVTFKDLYGYFYYGRHKDTGTVYYGSPKTWRFLWELFEPEVQILQWYKTESEVKKAEDALIGHTWKQLWNGKRYSLNRNYKGHVSEEACSRAGKKTVKEKLGIFNPQNKEKRLEGCKKGARKIVVEKMGVHDDKYKDKLSEWGAEGGHSSFKNKKGLFDIKNDEKVKEGNRKGGRKGGLKGGKISGKENKEKNRGIFDPKNRDKVREGYLKGAKKAGQANIRKYGKPVICLETSIIYLSLGDAEKQTGISKGNISKSARSNGEKSAGGLHWKFLDRPNLDLK